MEASWAVALSATLHCLTGCAIGEVLGMIIGSALGWSAGATVALSIALAFFFGYSLTSLPLLRSGMALAAVIPIALATDTVSIAIMEIVDNAIMVAIPGAMEAGPRRDRLLRRADGGPDHRGRRGAAGEPLADRARQGPRGAAPAPRALARGSQRHVVGAGHVSVPAAPDPARRASRWLVVSTSYRVRLYAAPRGCSR